MAGAAGEVAVETDMARASFVDGATGMRETAKDKVSRRRRRPSSLFARNGSVLRKKLA